ncbi:MAG: HAMP domain-containing sensor histidine kinase [Vicinamibacteria bacterium]
MTPTPFSLGSSRSRIEGGALLAVISLLCVLAVVQHRWLGAIAEGERRKLGEEATEKANAIAQAVDRELTRAFLELRVDGKAVAARDGAAFAELLERWQKESPHAGLVKELFVAEHLEAGGSRLLRFDAPTRQLVEEAWPESLAKVKAAVENESDASLGIPVPTSMAPVLADVPALLLPIVNVVVNQQEPVPGPPHLVGQIRQLFLRHTGRGPTEIVVLDPAYLKNQIVASIANEKLGPDAPFVWSVVRSIDGSDISGVPVKGALDADAKSPLLRVRFDDLDKSLLRGILPGVAEVNAESSVRFVVQLGRSGPPPVVRSGTVTTATSTAPWTLMLRHKDGSIAAAVSKQQLRNTALSASILGVLGLSAGLVFFSARRLRAIATQQVEFVAAVSHELRTPLAVIRSAADNLADGVVEGRDQAKRYGALIRDESVRLADMVEHVLEFAGADAPARALRGPIDAADAARAAVRGMQALAAERHASVAMDIPLEPFKVNGDLSHLTRAISNLLGNALKYGGDAPHVIVRLKRREHGVAISVGDEGAGLTPSEIPHLFEPFYRGQRASEAQIPGSGLGLALVKRIVESHGGRVVAANGVQGGALFTIELKTV